MKRILFASAAAFVIAGPALADCVLRQSDAVEVTLGPFVDSTDGNTEETALTISASDVILKKCTGAGDCSAAGAKNEASACAHDANGFYECDLDTTDTQAVGMLEIWVHESGALPVFKTCLVLEEAAYDAMYAAAAPGYVANAPVNVAQVSGDTTAADTFETWLDGTAGPAQPLGIIRQGTAQSAGATTIVLDASASFGDDTTIGMTVVACGSTQGYCQARAVTDYVGSTDTATVDTWTVTPSGTVSYYLFGTAPSTASGGLDAAGVRAAIGMSSANLDTQLSAIDDYVDTEVAAILDDTGTSGVIVASGSKSGYALSASGLDLVTLAEPSAKPSWASSNIKDFIAWLSLGTMNKMTQTSTLKTIRNDADDADLFTCVTADDGTTFTLSECTTP